MSCWYISCCIIDWNNGTKSVIVNHEIEINTEDEHEIENGKLMIAGMTEEQIRKLVEVSANAGKEYLSLIQI